MSESTQHYEDEESEISEKDSVIRYENEKTSIRSRKAKESVAATSTMLNRQISENKVTFLSSRDCLSIFLALTVIVVFGTVLVLVLTMFFKLSSVKPPKGVQGIISELGKALTSTLHTIKGTNMANSLSNLLKPSCVDYLRRNQLSSSGYYLVRTSTDQLTSVYCDMTRTCGNITGGWMRVAKLDLDLCPTRFRYKFVHGARSCVATEDEAGCTPLSYSSFNIQFSNVCGHVRGYAFGNPDGWYNARGFVRGIRLDENYLDGISISTGSSHIWSLAAGGCHNCGASPPFVGGDWSCDDSLCEMNACGGLLWNATKCGSAASFYRQLSSATKDYVEVRLCRNEARSNEDIALVALELFVQ